MKMKRRKEIPWQEPVIEPQLPFEPDWIQFLVIIPS